MFRERYISLVAGYASYHQDFRNKLAHFIGIPMLIIASIYIGSVPSFRFGGEVAGLSISLALVLYVCSNLVWFVFDRPFALVLAVVFAPFLWLCLDWTDHVVGLNPILGMPANLAVFLLLFIAGWFFQLLGHYFEGKRPAFVDNLLQGFMGPTFLVYEVAVQLGMRQELSEKVESEMERLQEATAAGKVDQE